jgi:hypothetical protein
MKEKILKLLLETEPLIRKEAEREKKTDCELKLFTEMYGFDVASRLASKCLPSVGLEIPIILQI